jgi:geranylgeranyl pyrophosphate synthase
MKTNEMNDEKLLSLIEVKLADFFNRAKSEKLNWNAEMSAYHFSTGGKRLRALIPCWIFQTLGKNPIDAIPLGVALELIHNATLVHDDLQDGDVVRRGKETVWKKYSEVQAINCGDALYQFATMALEDLHVTPATWRKVATRLAHGTAQVIEGQAQEFLMKNEYQNGEDPSWARYLGVVQGKTAALIAAAVVCAVDASESSLVTSELRAAAENSAILAGVLFQIQDDLLDIYGEKQRDRRATDIAEGKISALVSVFNEKATLDDRKVMSTIINSPREKTSDADIDQALHLFEKYEIANDLFSKITAIQSSVQTDPHLREVPELHRFLTELNHLFLKPLQNCQWKGRHGNQF